MRLIAIFAAASLPAVALGALVCALNHVPTAVWLRNPAAWVVGTLAALALAARARDSWLPVVLVTAPAIVAAAFLGDGLDGVHRWIAAGPLRLNAAMLVLPMLTIALACAPGPWRWLAALASLALLVLQPDASQATALAAATAWIVLRRPGPRLTKAALVAACAGLAALAWLRPDPLAPVPEVELILTLAAHTWLPLGGASDVALIAAAIAPMLAVRRAASDLRLAAAALTVCLGVWILAPSAGAFPVPFMGVGPSPILGAWLGVGLLAGLIRTGAKAETAADRDGPSPFGVARRPSLGLNSGMHGPTSHFYVSQRLRLHYVDWGNPDAPPLVLVHGGQDHCRNWDWVAQRLRDRYHIIAPDLRGHGDSAWATGGGYDMTGYIYDLAQLIHQKTTPPVTIIAHSLGAGIALNYAGVFPDTVGKLVAIEGLGPSPAVMAEQAKRTIDERLRTWVADRRKNSGRAPRRYARFEDAVARMAEENAHLSPEQARHLTAHGIQQNEDGAYSWKFDNATRWGGGVGGLGHEDQHRLWGNITAPVLLVRGADSWASDPVVDGRIQHFKDARLVNFDNAGHWVHHDQLDGFMAETEAFLRA